VKTQSSRSLLKQFLWKRAGILSELVTVLQKQRTPTDMAGSRIRQVQQLQAIAGTVGTHMGGTHAHRGKWGKKFVAAANRAHKLVRTVEELPIYSYQLACHYLRKLIKEVISSQLSSAAVTDKRIEPRIRLQGASPARSTGESAAAARSRDGIEPAASANCPPNRLSPTTVPPSSGAKRHAAAGRQRRHTVEHLAGVHPRGTAHASRGRHDKQKDRRKSRRREGGWGTGGVPRRRRRSCPRSRRAPSWPATW
jgi:hypothetical protein